MLLHITSDGLPIYQQIVDQIRYRIVARQLKPGEELPTIRGLAESLRVNPNTIARAYRELEQAGLIEKRRTTGTFVSESPPKCSAAECRRLLMPHIDNLLILSRQFGMSCEELTEQINKRSSKIDFQ